MNTATAADPRSGRVGGFGALFVLFLFALYVVVCLLAVGGIFEEVVTVRLFNLVARCKTKLKFLLISIF